MKLMKLAVKGKIYKNIAYEYVDWFVDMNEINENV